LNCEHIENYPEFPDGIAGYMLGPLLQQQAMRLGLAIQLAEFEAVRREGALLVVQMGDGVVHTKTGTQRSNASSLKTSRLVSAQRSRWRESFPISASPPIPSFCMAWCHLTRRGRSSQTCGCARPSPASWPLAIYALIPRGN